MQNTRKQPGPAPVLRILSAVFLIAVLVSCGPKKPIEPQGPTTPPPAPAPTPPPGETPAPTPEPAPTPRPPAPAPAPRQPAKGDTASVKLVDGGVKKMNAGDLESAEQMFVQALRVSPTNGKPYYYLGVVAAKKKDYERSLGFLEQAETFLKDDDFWMSQVLLQEALCLKSSGHTAQARAKLQEALRRDPKNQWAQTELSKMQ